MYLDLSGAYLVDQTAKLLASSLIKAPKLETLILKECDSQDNTDIFRALTANKSLRILDLSGNSLSYPISGFRTLSEMLQASQTLQVLRLHHCCLTTTETTSLFNIFADNQNTILQTFDVSDNSYDIKHLEAMLCSNNSLAYVEITVRPDYYLEFSGKLRSVSESALYSQPGILEYVGHDETLDSVCQAIVSAINKNNILQQLIIHTSLSESLLKTRLMYCQNYDAVKHRIRLQLSA